jgi:hypothetical protein
VADWTPELTLGERDGRCRLTLAGVTYGHGRTLQEAADDLIDRVVSMALALRRGGFALSPQLGAPDLRVMGFLHDIAERAAAREEIRERVLRG